MSLRDKINATKAEYEAEQAKALAADADEARRQRERDELEAAAIVESIPTLVRRALEKHSASIELCAVGTYAELSSVPGVAAAVRRLLTAEGLDKQLWIDIDFSGGPMQRNRLMLRI